MICLAKELSLSSYLYHSVGGFPFRIPLRHIDGTVIPPSRSKWDTRDSKERWVLSETGFRYNGTAFWLEFTVVFIKRMWYASLPQFSSLPDNLCDKRLKFGSKLEGLNQVRLGRFHDSKHHFTIFVTRAYTLMQRLSAPRGFTQTILCVTPY